MNNQKMMKMSNEELIEEFKKAGQEEKGTILGMLYFKNSGLIKSIANHYSGYEAIEDLMQESFFGLQTAAELYDPEKGSFSTYATIWIRQTVKRYIDNCGSCIRLPVGRKGKIYSYLRIASRYKTEFGREPSDKELAALLDVSIQEAQQIKVDNARIMIRSLDAPMPGEDKELTLGGMLATEQDIESEVIEIQDNERLKLLLWNEIAKLPEEEAEVITKRYKENMTFEETGALMGVDKQYAQNIQRKAFEKLRKSGKIRKYYVEYIGDNPYRAVGVGAYRRTGSSSVERIVMNQFEYEYKKSIEKTLREGKYNENEYREYIHNLYENDPDAYLRHIEKEIEETDKLLAEIRQERTRAPQKSREQIKH